MVKKKEKYLNEILAAGHMKFTDKNEVNLYLRHKYWRVREALAKNPDCPAWALNILIDDKCRKVYKAVNRRSFS